MANHTVSEIGGYLKRKYIGPIRKLLNNLSVAWSRLKKGGTEYITGESLTAYIPTNYQSNQGIASIAEEGTLPTPLTRGHRYMSVAQAYHYGRFAFTGQSWVASKQSSQSFANVIANNIEGMLDEWKLEMNRQLWGRGTGAIGRIGAGTTAVADGTAFAVVDASMLSPGMKIDTFTTNAGSGGTAGFDAKTIEAVDPRNNKIVMVEDLSGASNEANDYIYRDGSRGNVMMGYEGGIDGADSEGAQYITTFQGITRATNYQYQAFVFDGGATAAANRPITYALIQQAFEAPMYIGSGGQATALYSKPNIRQAYCDLITADRRFTDGSMAFDGGFESLKYSGGGKAVPWFADNMCPAYSIYMPNEQEIEVIEAAAPDWMDKDGSSFARIADKDAYESTLFAYTNIAYFKPNSASVLRHIAPAA